MAVDTGQGGLVGRDYSLFWNTNDHLLSQIYFLHFHPKYPFLSPSPSISLPLPFSLLLSPETNYSPSSSPNLCPLKMSSTAYSHTIKQSCKHIHTHTLRSVPLSSACLTCSLFFFFSLTRSSSRIFQWWLLSLSSPGKQRILVHTGQREGEGW